MKVFMCNPKYFDVIHRDLNYHMKLEKNVNKDLAIKQWTNLYTLLQDIPVEVELINPVESLVDMVFAANAALIDNRTYTAIMSNFRAIPRIPETLYWAEFLENRGYKIVYMDNKFEGQGDALFSHFNKYLWCGYGFRSNDEAALEISHILQNTVVFSLKLIRPEFYHLDTCFCVLDDEYVLYYPDAFDESSYEKINKVFPTHKQIKVNYDDAIFFTCNAVNIGKYIIIHTMVNEQLEKKLNEKGFKIIINNMSEFLLSGGSCKCCILHT